ncbi:hypothetical protein T06_3714 [Trichinella sp. T6]|nr:hypothetical protein T06_3714 [Trichinella sp. T6]
MCSHLRSRDARCSVTLIHNLSWAKIVCLFVCLFVCSFVRSFRPAVTTTTPGCESEKTSSFIGALSFFFHLYTILSCCDFSSHKACSCDDEFVVVLVVSCKKKYFVELDLLCSVMFTPVNCALMKMKGCS